VRWNDVLYVGVTSDEALERGPRLGEGEIPDCTAGGRCAPPEARTAVFAVAGVDPEIALAAREGEASAEIFLAPGTFPALPDHPLHEAIFGSPTRPNYRQQCGEPLRFAGEVTQAWFNLRVRVADVVPEQVPTDEEQVWVELDVETRIEGFDRNGVAAIAEGEEVTVTGRMCEGELSGPLADVVRPG
jgi:hypothetical protein